MEQEKKINLLVVPGYRIFPVDSGGGMAQIAFLEYMQHICNLSVVITNRNVSKSYLNEFKKHLYKANIFTIEEKEKKANLQNIYLKISRKADNWLSSNIFYKKREGINADDIGNIIKAANTLDFNYITEFFATEFHNIIKNHDFDMVQFDMPINLNLSYLVPSHIKKAFVHHEIKFEMLKTQIITTGLNNAYADYLRQHVQTHELAALAKFDAILTLTEEDRDILKHHLSVPVFNSPMPIRKEDFDFNYNFQLKKIVFTGNEYHLPNKYAVDWFLENVLYPYGDKINLDFYITGKWFKKTKQKYASNSRIKFTGYVKKINSFIKDSIMVVPVTIGSGIRTKILLAMAQGIPVISTRFACQGIDVEQRKNIFIANTPDEFLSEICFIKNNQKETQKICDEARKLVENKFNQEKLAQERIKIYKEIIG